MNNKLFTLFLGIILFSGIVLAANNSLISTTTDATPFWTNATSNPINISLNASQSQVVTFYVKPTGAVGSSYTFFGFVNSTLAGVTSAISEFFTVTIADLTLPVVNLLSPQNNSVNTTSNVINFIFNVSDASNISSCNLSANGVIASGAVVSTNGNYTVYTFTSDGTFNTVEATNISVLIVAGGGSGGGANPAIAWSGGGGGGGILEGNLSLTPGNYDIAVGNGGAGVAPQTVGNNGENSSFSNYVAIGGGGGGGAVSGIGANGLSGGSGGGGGGQYSGTFGIATQGNSGSLIGHGFNGYAGTATAVSGGGGGAGSEGTSATGGNGFSSSINGSSVTYAAGGSSDQVSGIANTGNGGGGFASAGTSSAGGSGIVIVRVLTSDVVYINSSSSITNNANNSLSLNLSNGNYTWSVNCSDVYNNTGMSSIYNLNVSVQFCQNNITNVSTAWTNVSCLSTNLMNQTRNTTIYDSNVCGNYTNTTIVEYQATAYCQFDTEAPVLTLSNYSGYNNQSVSLQINATDNVNISYWSINNTSVFSINQTGFITNITSLSVGNYNLNVSLNDTSNNLASGISLISILQACIQNLTNSTPTSWVDEISCRINDTLLQNRSFIEYDYSACGVFTNITHFEFQEVACNYCSYNITNVSTVWTNVSCLDTNFMNQTRNITTYDSNYTTCYLNTLLPSDLFNNITIVEYQATEVCDFCMPNLLNTSFSDWTNTTCSGQQMNQSRYLVSYDNNSCGEIANQTIYDYQLVGPLLVNTSFGAWNNISCLSSNLMNQSRNSTEFDSYSCRANITNIEYQATAYCQFDIVAPSVVFDSQRPADLNSLNVVFGGLNISYNISDAVSLNLSDIQIYYKQNSTTRNIITFVNGSEVSEWGTKNYTSNVSSIFLFRLFDREVYPATYNLPESTMNPEVHAQQQLNNSNSYVSIEFLNVTNTTQYNILEIMSNSSSIQQFYYCNSSYNFSGESLPDPSSSPRCYLFNTLPLNSPYNHTHTVNSKHQIVPLTINITTGMVGNVVVTSKSYILLRGNTGPSSEVNFYTIPNVSRVGAMKTTTNNGGTWTNQSYTVDSHLHQFSGASSLYYYVCANDTSNNQNCSSIRSDLYEFAGLVPTAVNVYSPTNNSYSNISLITINYTKSESPNGYAILSYNISLVDENDSFVSTIRTNNGVNLSYIWDSTGTSAGNYGIRVVACDVFAQCSSGYSQIFSLTEADLIAPILTLSNYSGYNNQSVSLQINATDNFNISTWSINDTSVFSTNQSGFITNVTLLSVGNYSLNITVNDTSNNLASGISLISILQACVQNLTNSTPTAWVNQTSCRINDTTLQNRSFVEYDSSACGVFTNVTHFEFQEVACNYCSYNVTNSSFTDWTNISCLSGDVMNQTRNKTEYDLNYGSCYLATLLPSDLWNSGNNNTHLEYQAVESCNYESPVISGIGYVVTSNQATITWNTNENSSSIIYYGLNTDTTLNVSSVSLASSHSLEITGLTASTLYYYNVSSCDSFGVCVVSNQFNFTTASASTTPVSLGGGGGGSGAASNVSLATIKKEITGLNVSQDIIEFPNIAVGVLTYKTISVENLGNSSISFSVDVGNLSNLVKFEETNFVLSAHEKRDIEFLVIPEKEAGSYSGKIIITSENKKYEIPVLIVIKSEKSLFDIMLYVSDDNKVIYTGDKLTSQISLIQAGLVAKEDVTLNYEIKDFSGNSYVKESETVMVYNQKEFIREFQTQNLPVGEYVLNAQVVYSGGVAPASTHFVVKERPSVAANYGMYGILIGAIFVVIVLSSLIIRYKKAIDYTKSKEN